MTVMAPHRDKRKGQRAPPPSKKLTEENIASLPSEVNRLLGPAGGYVCG